MVIRSFGDELVVSSLFFLRGKDKMREGLFSFLHLYYWIKLKEGDRFGHLLLF